MTLFTELDVDIAFMSESWERENLTLDQIITLENVEVISSVHQRRGVGGRPALIIKKEKYDITNLMDSISIPFGIEIVWALLSPKSLSSSSVKKIAIASIYSKPASKKKSVLLDHIAEIYHLLNSKYQEGLHFILCGDTNDLKLDSTQSQSQS